MVSETATPAAAQKPSSLPIGMLLLKLRTFIALIVVIAFFAALVPNFLSTANLMIMSKHVAINAFLAIGMTFVIITGGIDLSVGSVVGLAGMIAGALILHGLPLDFIGYTIYFNVPEIIVIALVLGIMIGAVNGFLVTKLNVAPFIATLGTLYAARGLALLSSGGKTFPNLEGQAEMGNTGFPWLGAGSILGIPVSIIILVLLTIGAAYLSRHTPLGRHIYAVGGNENAARLSGVKVVRTKMFVYMFSGFCSAIAGLIVASQLVAAHPMTGNTFELNAIAAAVLGGTSMSGGRGRIGGTIIGAFVIGILSDGLIMMGVSSFWQMVIKGVVIVGAVVIDQIQSDMQRKAALQQNQEQ